TKTKKKTTKTKVSTTKAPEATTSLPKKEKNAEIIARGLKLIKPLQDANIPASLYAKGPDGSGVFTLSKSSGIPGSLLIWPGSSTAKITIKTDKTKRQAV